MPKILINNYIDSTYLKTPQQLGLTESNTKNNIIKLVKEAIENKMYAVMLRPQYVEMARKIIDNSTHYKPKLGTVISFPEGTNSIEDKLKEAQKAIFNGADELDFVINYKAFKKGEIEMVKKEILACSALVLKKKN